MSSLHVRDSVDLGRVTRQVLLALTPPLLAGLYYTGQHANTIASLGVAPGMGWRGAVLDGLGFGHDPASFAASIGAGLLWLAPIYLTAFLTGFAWEQLFARVRGRETVSGLAVTALLFSLSLPATTALWQVALGISFGVVVAKEIFGGTGKNFLNPALAGLAFLYFAYPDAMRGGGLALGIDASTGATPLSLATTGGLGALEEAGITWADAFRGHGEGAPGEASALSCLLGGALLLALRVASWRIMAGALLGAVAMALAFDRMAGEALPLAHVPWYWHLTLGSFAFGVVFFATDPATAAATDTGRWLYGILVGSLVILIRVANPVQVEGVMLAILLGNIFAPVVDYGVIWANARRRARRSGA